MKKRLNISLLAVVLVFCTFLTANAATTGQLQTRIQKLEQELSQLKSSLEQEKKEEKEIFSNIMDRISLSGLVEVEGYYSSDYEDDEESNLELATVEFAVDAKIHDFVSSHVLFLYEEPEGEDIVVDEGLITLGNTEFFPMYMDIGRMYVPFGVFESSMISDPLTLEIAEAQETSAFLGFEHSGAYGGVYLFNGDIDEDGEEDHLENFGANLGYAMEIEGFSFDISGGYISNIADTDGLSDALPDDIDDYADGATASAIFSYQGFSLIGEYVTALDDFEPGEMDFAGNGAEPEAWNLELGYSFDLSGHETTLATAYQGTDEALAMELPENRYMASASMGFFENTVFVSLEYAYDEDYDQSDGGTDEEAHTLTSQVALEF